MGIGETVRLIDASIAHSHERIQDEVVAYIDRYPRRIGTEIARNGCAHIPTFAGTFVLTEAQLKELAENEQTPIAAASPEDEVTLGSPGGGLSWGDGIILVALITLLWVAFGPHTERALAAGTFVLSVCVAVYLLMPHDPGSDCL